MSERAVHLDLTPDSQQPGAKARWVDASASANLVEIVVTFEEETLGFALIAQRAGKPILHCMDNDRRPQPPFGNQFRSYILIVLRSRGALHHFPLRCVAVTSLQPSRTHWGSASRSPTGEQAGPKLPTRTNVLQSERYHLLSNNSSIWLKCVSNGQLF
jgi:hypothetical protein